MEIISIRKPILLVQIWTLVNVLPCFAYFQFPPFSKLQLPIGTVGPDSAAFDIKGGGPYTGVADGRVIKYEGPTLGFTDFAITSPYRNKQICDGTTDPKLPQICGRPYGLGFYYKTGHLYITDAYHGLLVVSPNGGLATQLVTGFQGTSFAFLDSLDIDQERGVIYFVDSGAIFRTLNRPLIAQSGDTSGRLFKYDVGTKQVTLLLSGLSGPAGVALSIDNSYVLISEIIARKIRRFWLQGAKAGSSDVFTNVEGNPDNIKRTVLGDFWVAVVSMKQQPSPTLFSVGQRINQFGKIIETHNFTAQYDAGITEVQEYAGRLYIGSLDKNYIGVYPGV